MTDFVKRVIKAWVILMAVLVLFVALIVAFAFWPDSESYTEFPGGHRFAVAICDDTDDATLNNVKPVYEYLESVGFKSTKTVWALSANRSEHGFSLGTTLEEPEYRDFVVDLQAKGFEIALHSARGASSEREVILRGLRFYEKIMGSKPRVHVNHSVNRDNLYWGEQRFTLWPLQKLYSLVASKDQFSGDVVGSRYFWGDIARKTFEYSREFSFHEINLAKIPGLAPYSHPKKNYVNQWFYTSDGHDLESFNRLLSEDNIKNLEKERGYTIVYTHFGRGFVENGILNETFKRRIDDLVEKDVWLTTTSHLLDYLSVYHQSKRNNIISTWRIEFRFFVEKLIYGAS